MTVAKQDKKKSKSNSPSEPAAPRKVPVYLPTSNPPKRRAALLIGLAVISLLWIGLLVYLALQQMGAA